MMTMVEGDPGRVLKFQISVKFGINVKCGIRTDKLYMSKLIFLDRLKMYCKLSQRLSC